MNKIQKIVLSCNMLNDFLEYSDSRIQKCSYIKSYSHVTKFILKNMFIYFTDHKLTSQEDGSTFYVLNKRREYKSLGYSGKDIGTIINNEQMLDNLFHEIFCEAEWIARSTKDGYEDVCKQIYGDFYNDIIKD